MAIDEWMEIVREHRRYRFVCPKCFEKYGFRNPVLSLSMLTTCDICHELTVEVLIC